MTKLVNDTVAALAASVNDAFKAADGAESKAAMVAWHLSVLLGDTNRWNNGVVSIYTWATSETAFAEVKRAILEELELDAKAVNERRKAIKDDVGKRALTADSNAKVMLIHKAMRLLGAIAILEERDSDAIATRPKDSNGKWLVPVSWYVDADAYTLLTTPKNPNPTTEFKSRRGAVSVAVMPLKGDTAKVTSVSITPNVDATITAAYGTSKRVAKPAAAPSTAPNDGVSIDTAAAYIGEQVARDDYAVTFSGDAADTFATLIAHLVRNETMWELIQAERAEYIKAGSKAA